MTAYRASPSLLPLHMHHGDRLHRNHAEALYRRLYAGYDLGISTCSTSLDKRTQHRIAAFIGMGQQTAGTCLCQHRQTCHGLAGRGKGLQQRLVVHHLWLCILSLGCLQHRGRAK
eukprot:gnl/TRDRNA2_/TRDRNA2_139013_c1_seq1.p1 gnl/TRDRNA2_/TRDRNA2_139013_c1~~gnl/TRDRNA2_/TRDRNA2_139013_c1_seq1.p1  ORF type:complete len:115 (+),score=0.96 gnl/TRDRNA2_/TRDRNA2_139013_c1_seq1:51-395(+)